MNKNILSVILNAMNVSNYGKYSGNYFGGDSRVSHTIKYSKMETKKRCRHCQKRQSITDHRKRTHYACPYKEKLQHDQNSCQYFG